MVAYLKKPIGSEGFQEIVDFLNGSHIRYALTTNPTIYVSLIEKFWQTTTVRTVDNGEQEITAIVDGKELTITEASVRRHLQLADANGINVLPNIEIFYQLSLMGKYIAPTLTTKLFSNMKRGFSGEHTPLFPSMLVIQAEEGEGSGHPSKPQPTPSTAQHISEEPIPTITSVHIPNVADEAVYEEWDDRVERATTTTASLDAAQDSGAKKPWGVPLLRLGLRGYLHRPMIHLSQELTHLEVMRAGRMIEEIDQDAGITLVTPTHSQEDQPEDQLGVLSAAKVLADATKFHTYTRRRRGVSTAEESVSTAGVSTAGASMPVSTAGMVQDPSPVVVKDKIKAKVDESEPELTKTKLQQRQERLGLEVARRLQEQFDEEERIEADEEIAARLQAEEREELTIEERSRLFVELMDKRKKYFAEKRAEERRNKPLTQAQ
ncbi:hypothetical protein Tco_0368579 [Tanacetum coccineum]